MTLVGALGEAGINEAYIAEQLKKDMEGDNTKAHINALNNAIELLQAEAQKKRQPINAVWQEIPTTTPKQIEQPNINSILEDTLHERITSSVSQTERVETIPPVNQVKVNGSVFSQTNRDTPIPAETSNKDRVFELEPVSST
jgi:hypothetical protein